jgi:hypothetical protein
MEFRPSTFDWLAVVVVGKPHEIFMIPKAVASRYSVRSGKGKRRMSVSRLKNALKKYKNNLSLKRNP